jgi:hypothetical protein
MNCWWVLEKVKRHAMDQVIQHVRPDDRWLLHHRLATSTGQTHRHHRKAAWRWVCAAGPPLIGLPGVGIAYGWPFLSGWGLGPAEAAGSGGVSVIAVPEPSSLLILSGALGLFFFAHRRFQCRSR